MYSKSSTFLALTSILVTLGVLSIAINNVEGSPIRRPFSSSAQETTSKKNPIVDLSNSESLPLEQPNTNILDKDTKATTDLESKADKDLIDKEGKFSLENQKYFQENFKNLDTSIIKLNFEDTSLTNKPIAASDNNTIINSSLGKVVQSNEQANQASNNDQLARNVNSELLRKAGYSDFIIRPKPFTGKIFDKFDINVLSSLNIIEKDVLESHDGNEIKVLEVYEFSFGNKETAQEIYGFLKAKIKNELGVTINETNQFGLSSFYINLEESPERVFLVVKTRDNVYALSYPKAKSGEKDYFKLTSTLLKELI